MFSHLITLTELLELELNDFWCLFISLYITQSKIKSGLPSPPPHPSNRPSNSLLQFELPGDCSQNGWMSPLSPQNMTTSFSQFPKTNYSDFPRVLSCLPAPSPILAGKTVCSKTVRLCPRTWPSGITWGCWQCPSGPISQPWMGIPLGGPQNLYFIKLAVYTHPGVWEPESMKPNVWKGTRLEMMGRLMGRQVFSFPEDSVTLIFEQDPHLLFLVWILPPLIFFLRTHDMKDIQVALCPHVSSPEALKHCASIYGQWLRQELQVLCSKGWSGLGRWHRW